MVCFDSLVLLYRTVVEGEGPLTYAPHCGPIENKSLCALVLRQTL